MIITYHGENYFKIQSGNLVLLVDPTNNRSVRGADVVLKTAKNSANDSTEPLVIDVPGEYEVKGIVLRGIGFGRSSEKKNLYRAVFDDMTLGFFGITVQEPDSKALHLLDGVDVLLLAGPATAVEEKISAKIVRETKPGFIIVGGPKKETANFKNFLKSFGATGAEEKIVIKKKDVKPGAMVAKHLKQK
jgi:hypothetical protein